MDIKDKIERSIAMIRKASEMSYKIYGKPLYLAFSGGKDSQCIYHLAKQSGVTFEPFFSPTTIDPPELIRFIKTNYKDVEFIKPKKSIYDACKDRGILPTRQMRWCCADYKEGYGANRAVIIGVRNAESIRRAKRKFAEKVHPNPDKRKQWTFDQFVEHPEIVAQCMGGGKEKLTISPIIEWTDADVWEYLNNVVKVEHCKLYDEGFTRIGCIGCPMHSPKLRREEFSRYPHSKERWLNAIQYLIEHKFKAWDLNVEQTFEWWVSGQNKKEWIADNILQYKIPFAS